VRTEKVDAIVGGDRLGLRVAEELERLGPFGMGNPGVRLLVPAAELRDVRPMGEEGRHSRFALASGAATALGVAFGSSAASVEGDGSRVDASVSLELNQWNGSIEPRVVLRELYPLGAGNGAGADSNGNGSLPATPPEPGEWRGVGCAACDPALPGPEWWDRLRAEREAPLQPWPARPENDGAGRRERVEQPPGSGIAALAELVSSGEPVLGICADVSRRHELADRAHPSRFGDGELALACGRCAADLAGHVAAVLDAGGLALADWAALEREPSLAERFVHVVVIDPPPFAHLEARAAHGDGYVHAAWGDAELDFGLRVHDFAWGLRPGLRELYRTLRDAGELRGHALGAALVGSERHPRSVEEAARCVRVLEELRLGQWEGTGGDAFLGALSSEGTELERSGAYLAYSARHEEGRRFLSRQRRAR
jgi:single-stranded-DNA-specific exonuclease